MPVAPWLILKSLVNYARYSLIAGIGPRGQLGRIKSGRRILVASAVPLGYAFYLVDRLSELLA